MIPYCTVGGRSSHTWFALSQLAGYPNVRLYEASWAEWGQAPGLPVEEAHGADPPLRGLPHAMRREPIARLARRSRQMWPELLAVHDH